MRELGTGRTVQPRARADQSVAVYVASVIDFCPTLALVWSLNRARYFCAARACTDTRNSHGAPSATLGMESASSVEERTAPLSHSRLPCARADAPRRSCAPVRSITRPKQLYIVGIPTFHDVDCRPDRRGCSSPSRRVDARSWETTSRCVFISEFNARVRRLTDGHSAHRLRVHAPRRSVTYT